jgi:hypothetical protein
MKKLFAIIAVAGIMASCGAKKEENKTEGTAPVTETPATTPADTSKPATETPATTPADTSKPAMETPAAPADTTKK